MLVLSIKVRSKKCWVPPVCLSHSTDLRPQPDCYKDKKVEHCVGHSTYTVNKYSIQLLHTRNVRQCNGNVKYIFLGAKKTLSVDQRKVGEGQNKVSYPSSYISYILHPILEAICANLEIKSINSSKFLSFLLLTSLIASGLLNSHFQRGEIKVLVKITREYYCVIMFLFI